MRSEALVLQTPMTCPSCRECLLRVMELDKGSDDVICLSCGGFGQTREVATGSALMGQAVAPSVMTTLQQGVDRALKEYRLTGS